jgi:hypothetical protein
MNKDNTETETKTQHSLIQSYCNSMITNNGQMNIEYKPCPTSPLGRIYGKSGIQNISGVIRGFLFNEITTDFDFKNCHPKIALYICRKNNIHCPNLADYCNNRNKWLLIAPDTKVVILKMLNNQRINYDNKNNQLRDLDKELKTIQTKIYNLPEYQHIISGCNNEKNNIVGSGFNRVLCYYENLLLNDLITYFKTKHSLDIAVPMFDGAMIYGVINESASIPIITNCEKMINDKWKTNEVNLDIQIAIKDHDISIQIPDDWIEPIEKKENDFDTVSTNFELDHAKIINKSVVIKQNPDRTFCIFTENKIKMAYSHLVFDDWIETKGGGYSKTVGFIGRWLNENPEQRRYTDFECNPYCGIRNIEQNETLYNIWSPFNGEFIKPDTFVWKKDGLYAMLHHISILCNHQQDVADYFVKWIGQMIQYPKVKTICPTLISKEGAGKGTLLMFIRKMLGDTKVMETTTPSRDVWGTFNNSMCNSFLVVLNELTKKDTIDAEGIIKGLITDPKITINTKGVSAYDVNSYHRFMITTNKDDPIKSKNDDRRNLIIRSSDEKCGDKQYFKGLYELLNDDDIIKTCYEYFKNIPDLDKFGEIPLPFTEYQQDIKDSSMSPIETFLIEYTTEILDYVDNKGVAIKKVLASDLFNQFQAYIIENTLNYKVSNVQFGLKLKRLNIRGITNKTTKSGVCYCIDIEKTKDYFRLGLLLDIEDL